MEKTKRCCTCKENKPLDEFYKCKSRKDDHQSQCRDCQKEYAKTSEGKAAVQKAQKKYQQSDKGKAAIKKYRQTLGRKIAIKRYHQKYYNTITGYLRRVYTNIKRRCTNPNHKRYKHYGGRGIKCLISFDDFRDFVIINDKGIIDINQIKNLQISRKNPNGHYCKDNLRLATHHQTHMNSRKQKTWCGRLCSSRFKGVARSKGCEKWRAYIHFNGKSISLGYFTIEEDAAKIYDVAALKYHGKYACTNKMLQLYDDID